MKNSGGRISQEIGREVRYLDEYGCASKDVWTIDSAVTDFKARVSLKRGDDLSRVHHKRILPVDVDGKAIAIVGDNRIVATCPKCRTVHDVQSDQQTLDCCSTKVEVYFMADAKVAAKKESQKFDLVELTKDYEVWTKESQFNDSIKLTTVQLVLLDKSHPRKMSFNLYNGQTTTSGSDTDLRLDEFKAGEPNKDKKVFWHQVDPEKYQKKLESKGYTRFGK